MKAIEVDRLSKSFDGREVLHEVSMDIERGDIFALLGPNGAGKTTTMRIILGILRPTAGRALVYGQDLGTTKELRRKVGVLFERHGLYERLTVQENLDYLARLYEVPQGDKRIAEVLREVGMEDRSRDRVGSLSTGLKRRVGLARALLGDPELLFLDEPTSNLDPQAQKDFRELIVSLSRDRRLTVFLSTHNLDEAQRMCNRVAILDRGHVRLIGRTEDLRASHPQVEIIFASVEEAIRGERVLGADDRVRATARSEAALACDLTAPLSIRDVLDMGLEIKEFKSRTKGLDEVYFDALGREVVA